MKCCIVPSTILIESEQVLKLCVQRVLLEEWDIPQGLYSNNLLKKYIQAKLDTNMQG